MDTTKIFIHVRRNKTQPIITTVTGFNEHLDLGRLRKDISRRFCCGTSITDRILIIRGDHVQNIKNFIIEHNLANDDDIITSCERHSQKMFSMQ